METKPEYETKALAVRQPLTPTVWQMILAIGQATKDSGKFGMHHAEEAAIKMLAAYEHGIPLTSALSAVYIIDNKPSFAPVLMWAKIVGSPDFGSYEETRLEENEAFFGWELTLKRKSGHQATRRFTMADARRVVINASGKKLAEKNNWVNYPEDTCYWRVMQRAAKVVFPDVVLGIYGADELGASITPEGEIIDATPAADSWAVDNVDWHDLAAKAAEEKGPQQTKVDMGFLVATWGADRVLEINEGNIPNTQTEIEIVCAKLRAQYPKEEEVF